MEFFEEMVREMNLRKPRIVITDEIAVLENVAAIVMLSETAVTVSHGKKYTTIAGSGLMIKEICEGRILIGGEIQRAEFFQSQNTD